MNTPLYKALIQHARRNSHSFHVPGHHNGDVFLMTLSRYSIRYSPLM